MFWKPKVKITDVGQLYEITPQQWFLLPYEQRIATVKLFLEHEFPEDYPKYVWEVFVLVEDGAEMQLRKWEKEGKRPFGLVPFAMSSASMEEGSRLLESVDLVDLEAELLRARAIAQRKRKR